MAMSILGAMKLAPSSPAPAHPATGRGSSSLHFHLANAGAAALVAASLLLADPALAFRGGGPYGQQVTRGLDFKTSILRQTNFKGANLLGASFFDADHTGADLSDADLRNADFSLANVTKKPCDLECLCFTNLEGALVTGNTSFKGSNIYGADFTDVPLRDDQRDYLCKIADGVNTTTGNATKETLFCK